MVGTFPGVMSVACVFSFIYTKLTCKLVLVSKEEIPATKGPAKIIEKILMQFSEEFE